MTHWIKSEPVQITLKDNVTISEPTTITSSIITFDLSNYELVFNCNKSSASALTLVNSNINYKGPGGFQVMSSGPEADALNIDGGSCRLTYAEYKGSDGNALNCCNGAVVVVNGNVEATGAPGPASGVNSDTNASVTINGSVSTNGNSTPAISANGGSIVTVLGDVKTTGKSSLAIHVNALDSPETLNPTKVIVCGSITTKGDYSSAIFAYTTYGADTLISFRPAGLIVYGNVDTFGENSDCCDAFWPTITINGMNRPGFGREFCLSL